ncbi:hypothetical protein A6F55_24085 [Prescottella equi]|nr:hypothetical protein A6F55_24085 [Prescottella equi]
MSLGVLTVVVLALIGWWLVSLLTGGNSDEPLNKQNLGLTTSAAPIGGGWVDVLLCASVPASTR